MEIRAAEFQRYVQNDVHVRCACTTPWFQAPRNAEFCPLCLSGMTQCWHSAAQWAYSSQTPVAHSWGCGLLVVVISLREGLCRMLTSWNGGFSLHTVNFAYNDTRRGIKKVSLFAKCRYTQSLIICITVGWDFALGMEIMSLFANCRYIRSRY